MKIIKTASGNQIKLSKSEWELIGKKAGWMKTALGPTPKIKNNNGITNNGITESPIEKNVIAIRNYINIKSDLFWKFLNTQYNGDVRFDPFDIETPVVEKDLIDPLIPLFKSFLETYEKMSVHNTTKLKYSELYDLLKYIRDEENNNPMDFFHNTNVNEIERLFNVKIETPIEFNKEIK